MQSPPVDSRLKYGYMGRVKLSGRDEFHGYKWEKSNGRTLIGGRGDGSRCCGQPDAHGPPRTWYIDSDMGVGSCTGTIPISRMSLRRQNLEGGHGGVSKGEPPGERCRFGILFIGRSARSSLSNRGRFWHRGVWSGISTKGDTGGLSPDGHKPEGGESQGAEGC